MKPVYLYLLSLLFVPLAGAAEDRFANVTIKTVPVVGNVYVLYGSGGNIGVSRGADGILMIDDQYAPLATRIKAALTELGSDTPAFVLNTHYHGDHTGSNAAFGRDSIIMAHSRVRTRLLNGEEKLPAEALPVITYEQQASIFFNGEEIRLVHMPAGHTDGDTLVYFTGSNVVHTGDTFWNGRFPYVDLEAGGSVQGLTSNTGIVLGTVNDTTSIIPGHGMLASKQDLRDFYDMLVQTTATVTAAMAAGHTVEQIVAAGLDPRWQSWGQGFINEERWIRTIFTSFTSQ